MSQSKNFLGLSHFVHFYGVVEDRMDPQFTGRVRVRCLGFHTKDKIALPTEDLPWAQVLLPITSSGISGIGQTPLGLVEGSWVVGYFRDGVEAQEPIVLGSLPGKPAEASGTTGFYDPERNYPRFVDEPDLNRLSHNMQGEDTEPPSVVLRKSTRITGVATSALDDFSNAKGATVDGSDSTTWDQPKIAYASVYPYNHTYESESGHIREYDDTSGAERIYEKHKTGTSYEINPNGGRVDIIKASYDRLTTANENVSIGGYKNVSLDGKYKLFINKSGTADNHYDIQVGAGANLNIQVDSGKVNIVTKTGDMNLNAGADFNLKVAGDYTLDVQGAMKETVAKTRDSLTSGDWQLTGSRIDLN